MTAKEKAKELIVGYIDIMPSFANQKGRFIMKFAKECALICVSEVLRDNKQSIEVMPEHSHLYEGTRLFYTEVEKELQKIERL